MLFSAEINDYRTVYNVLKAVTFREYAIVHPMEEGLKFTLEETKSVETSVYIPKNMFSSYKISENNEITFKISLKIFTECLNIFGDEGNPSLKMYHKTIGSPLNLVIQHADDNITVDCEIRTLNLDDGLDVSLADECNLNRIVINADILSELLQRLDNCADEIEICLDPDPPFFSMATSGLAGESNVVVSKHSDSVTLFECKTKTVSKYSFSNIRQILKVMSFAGKVQISTGESGLLGLQLVIDNEERHMYVEYYVMSQFFDE